MVIKAFFITLPPVSSAQPWKGQNAYGEEKFRR
jgi:hypothetical protein